MPGLQQFEAAYMAVWGALCAVALVVAVTKRAQIRLFSADYWRFLAVPWKLVLFAIAITGLTVMAPYTGDPTWDYVDAFMMSALTYVGAPWAVALVWRLRSAAREESSPAELYVALVFSCFAFAWSYDGYIVWRDGVYPAAWASNFAISGVIYTAAGFFWNLEVHPTRGVIFSFMDEQWPHHHGESQRKLLVWGAVFVLPVAAAFLWFVWDFLGLG